MLKLVVKDEDGSERELEGNIIILVQTRPVVNNILDVEFKIVDDMSLPDSFWLKLPTHGGHGPRGLIRPARGPGARR